ncbi:TonB-dependent siderophore receptor [Lysobacter sp. CA199]|uniref:TonB-dependent siderophore receptor n=1 Tax=Lysobacter sp. CA199 TaxID=3455608 RepID=UPI003F8D78CD
MRSLSRPGVSPTVSLAAAIAAALLFSSSPAAAQAGTAADAPAPAPADAPPDAARSTLPAVQVHGVSVVETANGPLQGYAARRSATGTKTDTPLLETPQSISVIGREELDARGVQTVMEAVGYAPGVAVGNWGYDARGIDWLLIRGFDATNSMFRDGLMVPAFSLTESYGLERVELLRGPASVTFGQSDAGGVINRVSKMPNAEAAREVELQIGSFDRKRLAADVGGALGDTLSYRVVGTTLDTHTQERYPNGAQVEVRRDYLAPSLRWQPSDATSLTLLGEYFKSKAGDDTGYVMDANGAPTKVKEGEPRYSWIEQEQHALGYLFEHRFGERWAVHQNLRYNGFDTDKHHMQSRLAGDGRSRTRTARYDADRVHQVTVDTNLQGLVRTGGAEHTLLFGVDWTRIGYQTKSYSGPAPNIDLLAPVYGQPIAEPSLLGTYYKQTTRQLGVYAQDQIRFADHWVVTLSGRQDRVEAVTRDQLTRTRSKQTDDQFSARAGLTYLVGNGWAPYVSYGESFLPTAGADANARPFEPSRGKQVEAGVKFQPEGAHTLVTAAVFDLTKSNVVSYDPQTGDGRQIGRIRSRGIELEAKTELTRGLDLTASYTWLDMKVTDSLNPIEVDDMPIQVPKQNAALWLDYTMDSGFGLGGGVRYIGRRWNDEANTSAEGGVALLDASAHYRIGAWRLAINVNNLAQRKYASSRAYGSYYPGSERSLLATVKYQF